MRFKINYLAISFACIAGFLFGMDKLCGIMVRNHPSNQSVKVETGDLLFRSNSFILAGSRFFYKSGLPGHVAVVISEGTFLSDDRLMGKCKVAEARYFDHTKKKVAGCTGISFAYENFGAFRGRRFLLRTHLTGEQKVRLIQYINNNLGKPYELFAGKDEQDAFNCATFVHQAILYSTGNDIDSDSGKIIFPNDIFKSPLFIQSCDRVRF